MRVIAFSCVHLCTSETQVALQDHKYAYETAERLMSLLLNDPPDVVVNLGDFTEPLYDGIDVVEELLPDYLKLIEVTKVYRLKGNHDRFLDYPEMKTFDGVRYEHGHKLAAAYGGATSRAEYTEMVRNEVRGLGAPVVHGHTHSPYLYPQGTQAMDVGSVTFSQTYGEIIDGEMRILNLSGEKKNKAKKS